jgi:hypothetical protein
MRTLLTVVSVVGLAWSAHSTAVYTLTNGVVFGLEFNPATVVAGERLIGTMILSNASVGMANINASKDWGNRQVDTAIGQFVVTDESGRILPKTIPYRFQQRMGSRGWGFPPGSSERFNGDVVWGYSLTNPGTYFVKAIANVPLTNDSGSFAAFRAETPALEITVSSRPADMPPAPLLYPVIEGSPEEIAVIKAQEEILRQGEEAMQRTAIQAAMPQVPRLSSTSRAPLPQAVQAVTDKPVGPAASMAPVETKTAPWASRNIVYGSGLLILLTAMGLFFWRSRHNQDSS